jgi:diphthamide biosynthesis protein 4
MAYTQDYYHVLGISSPRAITTASTPALSPHVLRSKYREALLRAHPDKQPLPAPGKVPPTRKNTASGIDTETSYTVDDVRKAFAVLSDETKKREYDIWLRSSVSHVARKQDEDFVLGLEILDLSDFDEVRSGAVSSSTATSTSSASSSSAAEAHTNTNAEGDGDENGEEKMEWRRPCRCGVARGFVIPEQELEDAIGRGEEEVLVGCAGCSLWVRVEFGIDETMG